MSSVEFGPNGAAKKKADPAVISQIQQELGQREHGYSDGKPRSLKALADIARIGLIVWCVEMALQSVMVAFYFYLPDLLPDVFFEIGGDETVNIAILSDWLIFLTALAAFVFVGRVTYRAQKNLFTIGSPYPKMAPGWTVGWYFIPVAAIWQPLLGMMQIYRGTFAAVGEKDPSLTLLFIWWGAWLSMNAPNWFVQIWPESMMVQFGLLMIGIVIGITAGVTLIRILGRIAERQELLLQGGVATVFD